MSSGPMSRGAGGSVRPGRGGAPPPAPASSRRAAPSAMGAPRSSPQGRGMETNHSEGALDDEDVVDLRGGDAAAESDSDDSSVWPPDASRVTRITQDLIASLTGETDPAAITSLDLHLRDGSMGRIRHIEGLSRLASLQQLNLSYNAVTRIENLSGLRHCLVELNLAENDINSMDGLFDLAGLRRLNLSGNRIARIDPEVRRLQALQTLRLGRNQLSVLDDIYHLGQLKQLERLRLDENPFYFPDAAPARALAVYCLAASLVELDGRPVTEDDKLEAMEAFSGGDDVPIAVEEEEEEEEEDQRERGKQEYFSRIPPLAAAPAAAKSRLTNMSSRVDQLTARLVRAEEEASGGLHEARSLAKGATRAAEDQLVGLGMPDASAIERAESVVDLTRYLCEIVVGLSSKVSDCSSRCHQLESENELLRSDNRDTQSYIEEIGALRKELRASKDVASRAEYERDDLRAEVRRLESGADQVRSQWMDASIKEAALGNTVAQLERDLAQTRARLAASEKEAHDNAVLVLQLRRELGNKSAPADAEGFRARSGNGNSDAIASYFDEPSTESESFLRPAGSSSRYMPFATGGEGRGRRGDRVQPDVRGTNLTELEVAASEAVCSVLLGEIRDVQAKYASNNANAGASTQPPHGDGASIEEACLRASLRLVHTATDMVRRGGEAGQHDGAQSVDIAPLSALGNTAVLESLVSTMKRGSSLGEDVKALSHSKDSLQALVDELTLRAARLEAVCADKEARAKDLDAQAEAAKARGLRALSDMQALAESMQRDREEVDALMRSRTSLTREIEAANAALSDARTSLELETRSLEALKHRAVTAREDADKWEAEAHKAKSHADEEGMRLRSVRAVAGEQVKMLQQELHHIQVDLRTSRRATAEQEQLRRDLEEEAARKRADAESMQLALARELDDASRKLSSLKTEIRGLRLEADKLSISKRQGEEEYSALEERKLGLIDLIASLEDKASKRTDWFDRQAAEQEKKLKAIRETVAAMSSDKDILFSSIDDIKKQHADLEAISASKRRAIDEEIAQAQQQALASIRASRNAVVSCEQKKVEAEKIDADCRAAERRLEELQRGVRDLEIKQDRMQESIRLLASDKDRYDNQLEALRKEEEIFRLNLRASEDVRRRLVSLSEEEASLKLSESRMKASMAAVSKQLEGAQHELEEIRSTSERERRLTLELRGQKVALEAEGARAEKEAEFLREQVAALETQEAEVRARISKAMEELSRLQRDLVGLQRKTAEVSRIEDEIRRKERAAEASLDTLQAELESTATRLAMERAQLETARSERDRISTEVKAAQDELLLCKNETATAQTALEKTRGEKQSLDAQKTGLIKELFDLKEANRAEMSRSESLSRSQEELERRLLLVREDVQRAEAGYAKAKELSAEEEARVRQQQKVVADAAAELQTIEGLLQQNNRELHESRMRSLAELHQLSRAKQSMSNHMLLLAEAQSRSVASSAAAAPSVAAVSPSHHREHSPSFRSGPSLVHQEPAATPENLFDVPIVSSFRSVNAGEGESERGLDAASDAGSVESGAGTMGGDIASSLENEMRKLRRRTEEILSRRGSGDTRSQPSS